MNIEAGTRVKVREDVQPLFPEDHVQDWAGKEGRVIAVHVGRLVFGEIEVRLDMHVDTTLSFHESELELL